MIPKAFVLGWPVTHSRSPLIHRFWLRRHGIEGDYVRQAVPQDAVEKFLRGLTTSDFVGGNVTVPHKEAAFATCDELTEVARRLGAVNTLWREGERLCGDNTDVHGFSANLDEGATQWREGAVALVLGAGGASRAVLQAVMDAGYREIVVLNRTVERAEGLARRFGDGVHAAGLNSLSEHLPRADLIVNATAAGLAGGEGLAVDWSAANGAAVVTDLVYVPLQTPFLQGAAGRGLSTVDGLGMLLHQAAPGFERWFGIRPRVDAELRAAVLADLAG
jgi:shikimate dehydrogenase